MTIVEGKPIKIAIILDSIAITSRRIPILPSRIKHILVVLLNWKDRYIYTCNTLTSSAVSINSSMNMTYDVISLPVPPWICSYATIFRRKCSVPSWTGRTGSSSVPVLGSNLMSLRLAKSISLHLKRTPLSQSSTAFCIKLVSLIRGDLT